MKIFNASKEAKMINQKLAMVRVHMYEGCKVTCDTQVAESKPVNLGERKAHL